MRSIYCRVPSNCESGGYYEFMNWRKVKEDDLFILKGDHISSGPGEYKIRCSKGTIWLTWPWSGDIILNGGEEISFRSEGTLCVKAFAGSLVNIKKRKIIPCVKSIPGLLVTKTFPAVLSFVRDGDRHSIFGDSVHSITR